MSPEVGVRETYRIRGEYTITQADYTSGRVFPDALCYAFYPVHMLVIVMTLNFVNR